MAKLEGEQSVASKVRYDWYQTDSYVIVNILRKNVSQSDLVVNLNSYALSIEFPLDGDEKYHLEFKLPHEIIPTESFYKALPSKVEIKLKKKEGYRWEKIHSDTPLPQLSLSQGEAPQNTKKCSSSFTVKNWDRIVNDIMNTDEYKVGLEGAVGELLEKIYAEGSDETKKAMNKSYVESHGTVLSTNWDEVKQDRVPTKPIEGVEFRSWNS